MDRKKTAVFLVLVLCLYMLSIGSAFAEGAEFGAIDMTKWSYNADDDVYYQVGIPYCASPVDESYETLAVFVPGTYLSGSDNGDGTWSCALSDASLNGYTAATAPIVMPINTPGYSAMTALTDYSGSVVSYMDAGFVYVHAGCRGRDAGAPAGVTDLKAAVRYLLFCDEIMSGDAERIFTFGMSGGGAHFDSILAGILSDLGSSYADSYAEDLSRTDSAGYTAQQRLNMYTPLYYLLESSEGFGSNTVARHWRIRSGIAQSDTALTTELNLALALENDARVDSVDFESVWAQKHVEAERSGSSSGNFIAWVNSCMDS